MLVKQAFEPGVEPCFHLGSYGYRPGRSALQAVGVPRQRCWQYDYVLEFDVKGLFDAIDHALLMSAVGKHTESRWVRLYIERWLKAPFQQADGGLVERTSGTPQGGVVSPVLANLFLHYVFDKWMERNFPGNLLARYADDGVVHCRSEAQARMIKHRLERRFRESKLELHPRKIQIVCCHVGKQQNTQVARQFDFLGYCFRPRLVRSRSGQMFVGFTTRRSGSGSKSGAGGSIA